MINYFSTLSGVVHAENAHWWTDPSTGKRVDRDRRQTLFLINSEISEAGEGERKDLMDPHVKHRKNAEVELADAMIRLLDYIGAHKYNIDAALVRAWPSLHVSQMNLPGLQQYFRQRFFTVGFNVGSALLHMQQTVCRIAEFEDAGSPDAKIENAILWLIMLICDYCGIKEYDLAGAITDKRTYNRVRADHSNKARLAAGGKKW